MSPSLTMRVFEELNEDPLLVPHGGVSPAQGGRAGNVAEMGQLQNLATTVTTQEILWKSEWIEYLF